MVQSKRLREEPPQLPVAAERVIKSGFEADVLNSADPVNVDRSRRRLAAEIRSRASPISEVSGRNQAALEGHDGQLDAVTQVELGQ